MAKNETKLQYMLPRANATDHQALLKARVATPSRRRQICKTTLPWRRPGATAWATAVCQTGRTAAQNSTFHGAGRPVLHRHTARFAQPYGRGLARGPRLSAFITALAATAYAPCPAPAGIGLQTAGTQTPFQSTWLSGALAVPLACRRGQRRRQPSRGRAEARGLQGGLSACEAWH